MIRSQTFVYFVVSGNEFDDCCSNKLEFLICMKLQKINYKLSLGENVNVNYQLLLFFNIKRVY